MKLELEMFALSLFLFVANMVAVVFQVSSPVYAQNDTHSMNLEGTVVQKNGNELVLKNGEQLSVFNLSSTSTFRRNIFSAKLADIKTGDKVVLRQDTEGNIIRVDALSEQLLRVGELMFPISLAVLGVGVLASVFWRKFHSMFSHPERVTRHGMVGMSMS